MLDDLTPKQLAEVIPILKKVQLLMQADPELTQRIRNLLRAIEEDRWTLTR